MRRDLLPSAALALFLLLPSLAGGEEGTEAPASDQDATDLIDCPTATVLPHASYDTALLLYTGGGVLFRLRVGIRETIHFGVSFGGTNVLGSGDPDWNPRVEFLFKGLLLRESYWGPAVALGFDSQGYGLYRGAYDRYQVKSKGFYTVLSKHFVFLGDLGLHGGLNYSLERGDDDEEPSGFLGVEKSVGGALDLVSEYDLATNDNDDNGVFGEGKGYWNTALLWRASENLQLVAEIRNLLKNGEEGSGGAGDWSRELEIVYRQYF